MPQDSSNYQIILSPQARRALKALPLIIQQRINVKILELAENPRPPGVEAVYATILYYLHNQEAVSKYVADWLEWSHQQWKAQEMNPHPGIIRLRERIAKYGTNPEVYKELRASGVLGSPKYKAISEDDEYQDYINYLPLKR